jgi:hypothetical protein
MAVAHDRHSMSKDEPGRRVAHALAQAVRAEVADGRLWVWSKRGYIEPGRDYVELWLYADATDPTFDQRIRRAGARLHTAYPDTNIRLHTITQAMLDGHEVTEVIRDGAEEIRSDRP